MKGNDSEYKWGCEPVGSARLSGARSLMMGGYQFRTFNQAALEATAVRAKNITRAGFGVRDGSIAANFW